MSRMVVGGFFFGFFLFCFVLFCFVVVVVVFVVVFAFVCLFVCLFLSTTACANCNIFNNINVHAFQNLLRVRLCPLLVYERVRDLRHCIHACTAVLLNLTSNNLSI